jgi:hypothetical protein
MLIRLAATLLPTALWAQSPQNAPDLAKQVADLNALVQKLQQQVDQLELRLGTPPGQPPGQESLQAAEPVPPPPAPGAPALPEVSNLLEGTSVNFLVDTYYGYNFNDPIGRSNRLRAYDVLGNAFSLNQATVVIENSPDPSRGKRWGARLDLQFGQATETLQGNAANEPRPEIYRNIFQAYGTYIVPVGDGLNIDFGKWASSLGIEGNFTQDQMNYSRSYWFNFLPFYHMGVRMSYPINKTLTVNYWLTNGTQQTEPFDNFKDELFGLSMKPNQHVSWNLNYYFGQEHPDVIFFPNSTDPSLPTLQGEPFLPIVPSAKGKLHIFDSYATLQASPALTFALEADYVAQRLYTNSAPSVTWGGAGYARYQILPRIAIAGRAEYLADPGGMFSGVSQALKETTLTFEQRVVGGFLLREEWRRDFSNQPYFYTNLLGVLKKEQNTATLGAVWWFGPKKGAW